MRITGRNKSITIDYGNGYVTNAAGQLLSDTKFVAYKSSLTNWEAPHEDEEFTQDTIDKIVSDVLTLVKESKVQICFE